MNGVALIFAPVGALRTALAAALTDVGFVCTAAFPSDEDAWHQTLAAITPLRVLVHAVPPPLRQRTSITEFQTDFERVVGSLWLGASLTMTMFRASNGGVIVALAAARSEEPFAATCGDGVRALAACLGVAEATSAVPLRAASLSGPAAVLHGTAKPDALARSAAFAAFLAGPGASYLTATDISLGDCQVSNA